MFSLVKTCLRCLEILYAEFRSELPSENSSKGFSAKRSLPNRQLLVGYWGQNAMGTKVSRPYWEKDLRYFCNQHKFDIYLVAFVHRLFRDNRNRGKEIEERFFDVSLMAKLCFA